MAGNLQFYSFLKNEATFFAIQANFHFTNTNFIEVKFNKGPLN